MLMSDVILPTCSTSTVCVLHRVKWVSMCGVENHVDLDSSWLNVEILTNNALEAPNVTRRHGLTIVSRGGNNSFIKRASYVKHFLKYPT